MDNIQPQKPYIDKAIQRFIPERFPDNEVSQWSPENKEMYLQEINRQLQQNPLIKEVPVPIMQNRNLPPLLRGMNLPQDLVAYNVDIPGTNRTFDFNVNFGPKAGIKEPQDPSLLNQVNPKTGRPYWVDLEYLQNPEMPIRPGRDNNFINWTQVT